MRNRGVGGILAVLCLAMSMGSLAQSGLLYLNEEPLSLVQPWFEQGSSILVPLEEFGQRIGLDISDTDGRVVVRGDSMRRDLRSDEFSEYGGILYVDLEWILTWVNGDIHRLGGDTYVRTDRPQLTAIDASADQVTVRLSGFSAHEVSVNSLGMSDLLLIHWSHAELSVDAQLIRVGESDIREVRLISSQDGVSLSIALEPGTLLATEQSEMPDSYTFTLRVSEAEVEESIMNVAPGVTVHEWMDASSGARTEFVYVDAWRDRFRLAPTVSSTGFQVAASLESILSENAAVAAISIDCAEQMTSAECLMMHGTPYAISDTPVEVLAIDLFGRWSVFSSLCEVGIRHAGQLIHIDGVNRLLAYGELVVYAAGYAGSIARSVPGSFAVIKIREDRVVSIYQGPFVPEDPSAILVVASGEAKAQLSQIKLGDPIHLVCDFIHAEGTYSHAVAAGPLMIADGVVGLDDTQANEISKVSGGTVLACDWQGGLYLLSFTSGDDLTNDPNRGGVLAVLASLPTALKDAVLLSTCGSNAIAYTGTFGAFQLGSQDASRLALGLIPLTP